jgi:hypothetical protein
MGLQGYNAKIKSRVPFSKKEEVFSLTLCLWQANFFSRKGAKPQRHQFFLCVSASSRAFFLHAIP